MYELMKGNFTQIFKKQMKTFKSNWCHMVYSETLVKGKLNLEYINDFTERGKKSLFSIFAFEKTFESGIKNTFLKKQLNLVASI